MRQRWEDNEARGRLTSPEPLPQSQSLSLVPACIIPRISSGIFCHDEPLNLPPRSTNGKFLPVYQTPEELILITSHPCHLPSIPVTFLPSLPHPSRPTSHPCHLPPIPATSLQTHITPLSPSFHPCHFPPDPHHTPVTFLPSLPPPSRPTSHPCHLPSIPTILFQTHITPLSPSFHPYHPPPDPHHTPCHLPPIPATPLPTHITPLSPSSHPCHPLPDPLACLLPVFPLAPLGSDRLIKKNPGITTTPPHHPIKLVR
ncbi:hypothetical protein Pcinc_025664 [Petrolisthes cinctipes]|uniref:Uncharacterized protein n=1 Tax=Petrolisthes cinctipes TaxID=88211 RepID=A0AAE1KCQ5_PETCI|nr:hypothetical protein Pcinc_025664 [Petrolisthes cinctipes]